MTNVEIKHVDLNEGMIRAIAKQAEAERLRRAKVINAEGEQQAAEKLVEAGRLLAREPQAMQLRYFAALHDIASERSSTIVFPLPTDLIRDTHGERGIQTAAQVREHRTVRVQSALDTLEEQSSELLVDLAGRREPARSRVGRPVSLDPPDLRLTLDQDMAPRQSRYRCPESPLRRRILPEEMLDDGAIVWNRSGPDQLQHDLHIGPDHQPSGRPRVEQRLDGERVAHGHAKLFPPIPEYAGEVATKMLAHILAPSLISREQQPRISRLCSER